MSTFAPPGELHDEIAVEPRTSTMAVLAFISSALCCIPIFTGFLGTGLGVISLLLIAKSNGRLRGRGFAFGAVVLGLLFSLLWIGFLLGGVRFLGGTINEGTASFESIDAGDYTQSRAVFLPALDQAVSDGQLEMFGEMIRSDFGGFVSGPKSFAEYWNGMSRAGKSGNAPGMSFGNMPIALEYEDGTVLAFMGMPDGSSASAPGKFIRDLGYVRPDGSMVWLSKVSADGESPGDGG